MIVIRSDKWEWALSIAFWERHLSSEESHSMIASWLSEFPELTIPFHLGLLMIARHYWRYGDEYLKFLGCFSG